MLRCRRRWEGNKIPLYSFSCECGNEKDKFYPLEFSDHKPICDICGGLMYKDFSRLSLSIDRTLGYYDKQLGEYVGSSSEWRKIMKVKGFTDCKPGEWQSIKHKGKSDAQKKEEYIKTIKDAAYKNNIPLPGVS